MVSLWHYLLAVGAPLNFASDNFGNDFEGKNITVGTFFTRKRLRLLVGRHGAIVVIFAVLAPVNNAAILGMDIFLLFGQRFRHSQCHRLR